MKKEFEMSMLGELKFFLGLQVYQSNKGIFISQTKYIKYILKNFKMEDSKPISTPMITGCKLSKNDESLEVGHTMYRYMIGASDNNVYIKFENINMIIVVVYIDDIIFGSDLQILSVNFAS